METIKSIEEKAKAYDEAVKNLKILHDNWASTQNRAAKEVESIFPELKESEDDKTKRILHSISSKISFHLRDIFTEEEFQYFDTWSNVWLEKQCESNDISGRYKNDYGKNYVEQKPAWSEEDDKIIEEIINDIECARAINYHAPKEGYEFRENWLKSLKERMKGE